MPQQSEDVDILTLCRTAFDTDSQDNASSQAAIKAVANTLLLHEGSRLTFGESDYPQVVADRLRVSG